MLCRTVICWVSFGLIKDTCMSRTYEAVLATTGIQRTISVCSIGVLTTLRDSSAIRNAAWPTVCWAYQTWALCANQFLPMLSAHHSHNNRLRRSMPHWCMGCQGRIGKFVFVPMWYSSNDQVYLEGQDRRRVVLHSHLMIGRHGNCTGGKGQKQAK